jgi:hypothetical protein
MIVNTLLAYFINKKKDSVEEFDSEQTVSIVWYLISIVDFLITCYIIYKVLNCSKTDVKTGTKFIYIVFSLVIPFFGVYVLYKTSAC